MCLVSLMSWCKQNNNVFLPGIRLVSRAVSVHLFFRDSSATACSPIVDFDIGYFGVELLMFDNTISSHFQHFDCLSCVITVVAVALLWVWSMWQHSNCLTGNCFLFQCLCDLRIAEVWGKMLHCFWYEVWHSCLDLKRWNSVILRLTVPVLQHEINFCLSSYLVFL